LKPLVIASTSFQRFYRDRTALFFTIIFPVILLFLIGSATARFDDPTFPVGLVENDPGPLGSELARALEREPALDIERFDDREAVAKLVRRGTMAAGIVVPSVYDANLRAGRRVRVELLVDQTRGFPAAIRSVVNEAVTRQGAALQAAAFAARNTGRSYDESLSEARRTSQLVANVAAGVQVSTVGRPDEQNYLPPGYNYQGPSQLLLFVFITSLAGSAVLIQSRRLGVTRRMLGSPTTARTILAGETLGRFVIAAFQALFMFVVGTTLFGITWGAPLGAVAVIVLFVLVGTSSGMLFGSILSTPEQAGAIGAPLGIAAGMLGGCMWPLEIVPKTMQQIGHAFPHAWAMDAWIELIGRGGGIGDISRELLVLAGYVAVLFPLAAWRLRRVIVAP
jgi:ABC-2 type transport system permease protein